MQSFGGQLRAHLASSPTPVYWQGTVRFIHEEGFVIVSHGYSGTQSIDHVVVSVNPALEPGASADAGYTLLSSVGPFRDWQYQPNDLDMNTPIRMELQLTPFADAQFMQPLADGNPGNNLANLWVTRACGP